MSLRQLESFIAIAETGSFNAAANRLGVTQSAISMQIKALEDELRADLFDRSKRPPVLNDRGLGLLDRARRVIAQYQDLQAAALEGGEPAGTLRLGVIPSVTTGILPDALANLSRWNPALQVRIQNGLSTEVMRGVVHGELDAAILTEQARLDRTLSCRTIIEEEMLVVAPAEAEGVLAEDLLSDLPFIRFNKRAGVGRIIDKALRDRRIRVTDAMELDSIEAMLMMVSRGLGVCIAPKSSITEVFLPLVKVAGFTDRPLNRRVGLVELQREAPSPLTGALFDALRHVAG